MPRKARATKRRPRASQGLNKKEKSQVTDIAKKAVQVVAEKKFMDSSQYSEQSLVSAHSTSPIAVAGYSTTEDVDAAGAAIVYGLGQLKEGLCLKPFMSEARADTQEEANLSRYAIIGKSIIPRKCHSRFRFRRTYSVLDNEGEPLPGDTSPFQLPSTTGGLGHSLPVYMRVIRVTPKGQSGTTITHLPSYDLFQDKYGEPLGVSSFDSAGDARFGTEELIFSKINTRKYTVLDDKRFTLQNPMTLSHTAMDSTAANHRVYLPMITNTNANCEKYLNMNHQLSRRKGGKIHYNEVTVQDPSNPALTTSVDNSTSGQRREMVFIHACFKGDTGSSS